MPAQITPGAPHPQWHRVATVLALAGFAVGTDVFVVAGLLPSIANSFTISIGTAGQIVTVFALAYAISAPITGGLAAGWPRRTTLVVALLVFAAGNALTALAPGYALVLLARTVAAVGAGMYTATASATVAELAGPARRGQAISIVVVGLSASLAFGAPLGTAIGTALDWRVTLWLVAAMGLVAAAAVQRFVPAVHSSVPAGFRQRLSPLANRRVQGDLLRALTVFTAVFLHYTYVSVVYAPLVARHELFLTLILLSFGVAGCVGSIVSGRLVDRLGPLRVQNLVFAGLAGVFLLIPWLSYSPLPALAMVSLSGMLGFALPAALQHELLDDTPPGTQSVVTSLYQSALYFAISLAAAIGPLAMHVLGERYLTIAAAAFAGLTPLLRRPRRLALANGPCAE